MGMAFAVQFASFAPSAMSITKAFLPGIESDAWYICTFFVPVKWWENQQSHEEEAEKGRGCQKVLSLATTVAYVDN